MRRKILQRVATLLSALTLAIMCLPRAVFCIGTDGHVAIEPVGALCCHPPASTADSLTRDPRCAPGCMDTPLGISLAFRTPDRQDVLAPLAVAAAAAVVHLDADWANAGTVQRVSFRAIDPPRSLRTTINLC